MYQAQFVATTSADWAEAVELIDDNTSLALDVPIEAEFKLSIGDRCWGPFNASTEDGKVVRAASNILTWRFTPDDLSRFWRSGTYSVGLTMTTEGGTQQLLVGTLSIIDGIVP